MTIPLPIVATRTGGIPEIITHGSQGLLARPEDPVHLAEQLLQMIHNPDSADWMAGNAREKVKEFSFERTAQLTLEAYRELLGEDR